MRDDSCSESTCTKTGVLRRGMCENHYRKWRRRQTELPPIPSRRNTCAVTDCERDVDSHGYCRKHADRWKRNGHTGLVQFAQEPICQVPDCGAESVTASLCSKHYARKQATGDPERTRHWPRDVEERLVEFVNYDGLTPRHMPGALPCWNWTGATSRSYGRISANRENVWTHRLMYERHVGPIPDGLDIDHLCLNTACCNPAHLEPVTPSENSRRAAYWRKARAIFKGVMYADYGRHDPLDEAAVA